MAQLFGILAGILMLLAGVVILIQIKKGLSIPNLTTWLVVLLISIINAITFYNVVRGNIYQSLIMFTSLFTVVLVFFYALNGGKFARLTSFDIFIFSITLFVGILWKLSSDDRMANLLVQLVIFIANLATIIGLWRGTLREYYLGWIIAGLSYVFAVLGLIIAHTTDWLAFFGPVLNGIICNGVVLMLSLKKKNP